VIRLFAGSDSLESYNAAKLAAETTATDLGTEVIIVNADEANAQNLWDDLQQIGLFSSQKVQLWKRVLDNKDVVDMLLKRFEAINSQNEIIIWEPADVDARLALVKKLSTLKQIKSFAASKPWEIGGWLSAQIKAANVPLTFSQQKWLVDRIGSDKLQLQNEITKISLYYAANQKLDTTALELLIPPTVEMQIWTLLDSLSLQNKASALAVLDKFATEDNLQYVLTMLSREITLLAKVKYASESRIALTALGINDFVLKKAVQKAQNFSLEKLKKLSTALFRLDTSIKRGKTDPLTGLFLVAMAW